MSRPRGAIGVLGLWHLGCVTAACLAEAGHEVIAVDPDPGVVTQLREGHPPVFEPGLAELIADSAGRRRLHLSERAEALSEVRMAWVAFDTPVDDDDRADVESVLERCVSLLGAIPEGSLVVVSSQLPVGTVARLERTCARERGDRGLRFACVPENLRLGGALDSFRTPDRIVAGVRNVADREELEPLLAGFCERIEWMGVESAEMTKHALNGFLATSVAFVNEVAAVCEVVGADATEVSRGLTSDRRIGPGAYLRPGDAFAGGTLARDLVFLRALADEHGLADNVLAGVIEGNAAHRGWSRRKLAELLGIDAAPAPPGITVAVWGLTYKAGTDTLRRSGAVELCRWLAERAVSVRAHDPAVRALPGDLGSVTLCRDPLAAALGADALVVCTPWPDYRQQAADALLEALARPLVIDPAGFLADTLGSDPRVRFVQVGRASSEEAVPHR